MSKKIIPSIILYIFSGLMGAYAIWSIIRASEIISEALQFGQITVSGNLYDITSFYVTNCGFYVVYALLLFAVGLILQRQQATASAPAPAILPEKKDGEEELDEWFGEPASDEAEADTDVPATTEADTETEPAAEADAKADAEADTQANAEAEDKGNEPL